MDNDTDQHHFYGQGVLRGVGQRHDDSAHEEIDRDAALPGRRRPEGADTMGITSMARSDHSSSATRPGIGLIQYGSDHLACRALSESPQHKSLYKKVVRRLCTSGKINHDSNLAASSTGDSQDLCLRILRLQSGAR